MRKFLLLAVTVVACSKAETPPPDSTAAMAPAPAPAILTAADVAGTWNGVGMLETGDSVDDWIARTPWVAPLAKDPATLSNTSICLRYTGADGREPPDEIALKKTKAMCELLAKENAAFDIASYRGVPAGFRIWTGATIESSDVKALTAWIDWAHDEVEAQWGA